MNKNSEGIGTCTIEYNIMPCPRWTYLTPPKCQMWG